MFFDLFAIEDATANESLECMCKSLSEPGAGDDAIWALHESPFVQTLIEAFTLQGLATTSAM